VAARVVRRKRMTNWSFVGASVEGDKLEISGVRVWEHKWVCRAGERADVKDPSYGQVTAFVFMTLMPLVSRLHLQQASFQPAFMDFTYQPPNHSMQRMRASRLCTRVRGVSNDKHDISVQEKG